MDVLTVNLLGEKVRKLITKECHLNLSQIRLLLYFKESNNDTSMQKVADDLGLSLSTLSRQINQEKTKQYISLHRSKNDSRKLLHLNQKGLDKLHDVESTLKNLNMDLFSSFNEQENKSFAKQVDTLMMQVNQSFL